MKKTGVFRGSTLMSGSIRTVPSSSANGTSLPFITYDRLGELDQGAIVDNKRLGRALEMIKLVQDKRDNTRSQALPSLDGQTSRRKKQPGKKSQRSLNQNDMLEALQQLQARSQEIFGKS